MYINAVCLSVFLCVITFNSLSAQTCADCPKDNPVATHYSGSSGYPLWTDEVNWDIVIDMSRYSNGTNNFQKFENARDELFAKGGGVLYYPAGTYNFEVPKGPNGRGLMLKEGVVIRGQAPASDKAAVKSYSSYGLSSLPTVFTFTAVENGKQCLMNFLGCTPATANKVGAMWINFKNAYVHFGFSATAWSSKWSTGDCWLTGRQVSAWGERRPDGTFIMDPWVGDGTAGRYNSGSVLYGSKRFLVGCKMENAFIENYAINNASCSSFSSDAESWRFGGVISMYGSHILVANNVVPKVATDSKNNRLVLDINKNLLAFYTNRCDIKSQAGFYGEDVVVMDNWFYNKGNKTYEVSGNHMVVRNNKANKDFLSGTPTVHSCLTGDATFDYMNRGFDIGGSNVWVHNNEVHGTGSGGNDGEGILGQRHNELEIFSHAWTFNYATSPQGGDKGYIAPYDMHATGFLVFSNKSSGNVGIRKPASNYFQDISIVKNEAGYGITGTEVNDCLSSCPTGTLNSPVNVTATPVNLGNQISWEDNSSNEIGFRIERKINNGTPEVIAFRPRNSQGSSSLAYNPSGAGGGGPCNCSVPSGFDFNEQKWIDYLIPENATIAYRVVAVNCENTDEGASEWIQLNSGDTQAPTAPLNLTSPSKTNITVSLSWNASTDNVAVTGYDIFNGTTKVNSTPVTTTNYTVSGLAAGTAYTFTVKAVDAAGNISPASNSLTVTTNSGTIEPGTIKVNFQPNTSTIPEGYVKDIGDVFGDRGNDYSYGWDLDNFEARDRNVGTDGRYSTLNHMQKTTARTWEIALPDGVYSVTMGFGDPSYSDQINTIDIEGQILIDPNGESNFDEYVTEVEVVDGRLTIKPATGSSNAKICFVEITPVPEVVTANSQVKTASLSVYPNPASEYITIEMGEELMDAAILMTNVLGQTVEIVSEKVSKTGDRLKVNVGDLEAGVYLLTLVSKENTRSVMVKIK